MEQILQFRSNGIKTEGPMKVALGGDALNKERGPQAPAPGREDRDGAHAANGISISHVNAWFGKSQALKDISFEVPGKRVTAVIGPSGCGKSTLIRCINRMHETIPGARAEGRMMLNGHDLYARDADPVLI